VTKSALAHIAFATVSWIFFAPPVLANDLQMSRHDVTICTTEVDDQWVLRAHGTLTRIMSRDGEAFSLDLRDQTFTWRVGKGSTYPGFLIDAFPPLRFPRGPISMLDDRGPPRGQRLYVNGEVLEHAGSRVLSLRIGATCPSEKPNLWPNPTVERDARKSGARPSP